MEVTRDVIEMDLSNEFYYLFLASKLDAKLFIWKILQMESAKLNFLYVVEKVHVKLSHLLAERKSTNRTEFL